MLLQLLVYVQTPSGETVWVQDPPARLIFCKQQEFAQNQLCQTKLISFVDGVTGLVGFSRI